MLNSLLDIPKDDYMAMCAKSREIYLSRFTFDMFMEHPKYTQISQDDLQRLDTGRKNILKDSSLYAKATDKIRLLVNDSCNHAICLQLFGEAQNYFNYHIDQYDTDISQYPIGNITIRSNWNYFDVGKYNTYKRFFSYIVSCLQTQFPDATIVSYSTEAKISF